MTKFVTNEVETNLEISSFW